VFGVDDALTGKFGHNSPRDTPIAISSKGGQFANSQSASYPTSYLAQAQIGSSRLPNMTQ